MRRCNARTILVLLFAVLPLMPGARAGAQDVPLAEGPRFLFSASADAQPVEIDASRIAALGRKVSLTLDNVRLEDALDELSRQVGVRFVYVGSVLPLDKRVQFRSENITVAAALTELLFGLRVDVVASGASHLALVRREQEPAAPVGIGAIVGRVTEAESGSPIVNAQIAVDGRGRTITDEDGRYRIDGVAAGLRTVSVTSIGYARVSQEVEVGDDATVTVDFALEVSPSTLDAVVATATGSQRVRELGHVVGQIDADSIVREAPVSSVSELLNARVPGLQVFTNSGMVGGKVSLQVRSPNSIFLGTEPIVIVDGIRHTSGTSGWSIQPGGPFNAEPTSRLNDLNLNDIETIEVVKGPSATTLYGTDAANGVLVITTKQGRRGPARWNAYVRTALSEIPSQLYPEAWWGWSDEFGLSSSCSIQYQAREWCQQDSVTVLSNPLNDPSLTIFRSKPRWQYGANIAAGGEDFRYYVSSDFEQAIGPIQMPPAVVEQLEQQHGSRLPKEQFEPNAFTKANLRANLTASLGPTAELHVNTGYVRNATRTLSLRSGTPYLTGATQTTPGAPYGHEFGTGPEELFALSSTEETDRFFGSAKAHWRPRAWLEARATVGLDLASSNRYSLVRPGESSAFETGRAGDGRTRQLAVTADLGLTSVTRRGPISFRTAVGAQYARTHTDALSSIGTGLPPGGKSIGQAAIQTVNQSYGETVTLGSYVEETLGFNDRLFLTGALRVDGASAFGRDYDAAVYPKAGVSWLISEEPFLPRLPAIEELRFRYAFGASGQQALSTMVLPTFVAGQVTVDGAATNRIELVSLGNADLRPERVREHEFGLDVNGLGGYVQLALTWFRRTAVDQVIRQPMPPGFGRSYTNLGFVKGHGFEAQLTAQVVNTRSVSWRISLHHAFHRSLLMELGDASPLVAYYGGYIEGYPLGARFTSPIMHYADVNGDGLINPYDPEELAIDFDNPVYVGESTPPQTQTVHTSVGLFDNQLRLSGLIERRSGFTQVNLLKASQCSVGRCRGAVDPNTPLAEQAEIAALLLRGPSVEPGDFTRLREVTAALELPARLVQRVRLRAATLSLAVRNVALWTSFSGPDPESASVSGWQGETADGIPQSRSWVVRLDLGW